MSIILCEITMPQAVLWCFSERREGGKEARKGGKEARKGGKEARRPGRHRTAQDGLERPRTAQNGPGRPRTAQDGLLSINLTAGDRSEGDLLSILLCEITMPQAVL